MPDFPNVPTVAETIPDFLATGWAILVAPVGTSDAIVRKVSEDLYKAAKNANLDKKLAKLGSYTHPMLPDETVAFVRQQQNKWNPVLADIARTQQK